MAYLLLVQLSKKTESYYSDDPETLKEYAEVRGFDNYKVYKLGEVIYMRKLNENNIQIIQE